jgi:hypothetical protein
MLLPEQGSQFSDVFNGHTIRRACSCTNLPDAIVIECLILIQVSLTTLSRAYGFQIIGRLMVYVK